MTQDIVEKLVALVARELKIAADDLGPKTPLFEGGLELDSFAVVDLVMRVEAHFAIQFLDGDFSPENFADLQTLGGVVHGYVSAAGAKA